MYEWINDKHLRVENSCVTSQNINNIYIIFIHPEREGGKTQKRVYDQIMEFRILAPSQTITVLSVHYSLFY